ncbi:hypothetical protein [Bradyrhizobium sp. USDA 3315]
MRIGFQPLGLQFQEPQMCGWHECNRVPSEIPAGSFNGHITQELDRSAASVLAQILHRVQMREDERQDEGLVYAFDPSIDDAATGAEPATAISNFTETKE